MGSIPVPGEWFDNIAADETDRFDTYDEFDLDDELDDHRYGLSRTPPPPPPKPDPLSKAVLDLRALSRQLRAERHPAAHIPQQIANSLLDIRNPAPQPRRGQEASPTGNCTRCGDPLPLPSLGPGRPRTMCTRCSPPKR